MSLKPITLYSHKGGPNPFKTALVLRELDLPFTAKIVDMADMKKEPFLSINPNGRAPAIQDPNTNIILWESCAIIEYLVETYDTSHTISFPAGTKEAFEAKQWMYFQASGQGPYFGQAAWFTAYHSEKVPSAVERYVNEIKRVSGVLDKVLQEREWLVGGRYSYVDAAFLPWYEVVAGYFADKVDLGEFPSLYAWLQRIKARPAIKEAIEEREKVLKGE